LEDLFAYKGENYVPEDYRHEEFEKLRIHLNSGMHYKDSHLHSIDVDLDELSAKMHVHPLRFEEFKGHFHYGDDHLKIENFHGKLGRTSFDMDLNYYLGDDPKMRVRNNLLNLNANYIDFDELHQFNLDSKSNEEAKENTPSKNDVQEHAEAYNLYELPFTDMAFNVDVGHFIYHKIDLQKIKAQIRSTQNHYIYIDTLSMMAAGGHVGLSGYFNGSDPKHIYLKPQLDIEDVDIDKLMFKFENFGQDALVSDNIHGQLSAKVTGNIRVYPDLVPDLDQSEVHMDVQVLNGRLENYEYMQMLSDYMGDKDLSNVRFDTLQNHMDMTYGKINIPNMTIESSLGHFDVSGSQDMDDHLEYYVRIPWKIIKQGARNKLFGSKKTAEGETGDDEIIEKDPNKKTRYLNVKIESHKDDYKITLGKKAK
jgi:hypothetical protein